MKSCLVLVGAQGAVKALNKIQASQVMQLTITMYVPLCIRAYRAWRKGHKSAGEKGGLPLFCARTTILWPIYLFRTVGNCMEVC